MPQQTSPVVVSLIVPCYNEADNIPLFIQTAEQVLQDYDWHVCFVDDGSSDESWRSITQASAHNPRVHGISFARNFGHQNALKAGIEGAGQFADADVYITLDADLQHPLENIPAMIQAWQEGHHIVQMQREDATRRISFFKKATSKAFYGIFSWLSGIKMQAGMSDFRLMDRAVISFIKNCAEKDLFLRGLLTWSGYKTKIIPYVPKERIHGSSKFTLRKMTHLAMSGIIGYSARPLHISISLGLICILLAIAYFAYVIISAVIGAPGIILGWPSLIATVLAMGGVQLTIIGLLGIYLGKLYMEQKNRPTYIVEETTKPKA